MKCRKKSCRGGLWAIMTMVTLVAFTSASSGVPRSTDPYTDTPTITDTATKPGISLDVSGVDVKDVVSALASNFKVNVALPPDLTGAVTVVLKDIGLNEALRAVLEPLGYEWETRESVIYVRKKGEGVRLQASYDAGKLTLDAERAPLKDVAKLISSAANRNIIVDEPARDIPITISAKNTELAEGLRLLAKIHKLAVSEENGSFILKKAAEGEDALKEAVTLGEGGRVTVKAQKTEIAALLTQIASKTGVSVGIEQGASGQVTADLKDVDAQTAIRTLAELAGLSVEEKAGVYQVFKPQAGGAPSRGKPAFKVEYADGLVSLDISKGDLGEVINAIIQKSGLDFVVYGSIRDQIDARMDSKPLNVAMTTLLQGTRYSFRKLESGVYMIGDKTQASPTSASLTDAEVIQLRNLKAEDVVGMMPPSIPTSGVKVLKEQNAISVKGSPDEVAAVKDYVEKIDNEPPVIEIEAMVVEISDEVSQNVDLSGVLKGTATNKLEISPGKLTTDLNISNTDLNESLQATLNALVSDGKASVKVKPKISVLSGNEANIDVTREEFFKVTTGNVQTPLTQLEKVTSGIRLTIKPWASVASSMIRVNLKVEVSSPTGVSAEGLPAISARKANTEVSLNEGQTLVVGGLFQEREAVSEDRFPYLGKIPLLGYAFKKEKKAKAKNELIFYITPRIISKSKPAAGGVSTSTVNAPPTPQPKSK